MLQWWGIYFLAYITSVGWLLERLLVLRFGASFSARWSELPMELQCIEWNLKRICYDFRSLYFRILFILSISDFRIMGTLDFCRHKCLMNSLDGAVYLNHMLLGLQLTVSAHKMINSERLRGNVEFGEKLASMRLAMGRGNRLTYRNIYIIRHIRYTCQNNI